VSVEQRDVAVVGAGPYGLAIAAACTAAGRSTVVFGPMLETWRQMPSEMELRAAWREMSLTGPGAPGSLEEWEAASGVAPHEPMTVTEFIAYATWFADRQVAERVDALVTSVERNEDGRLSVRAGGGAWHVSEVVVAPGIGPFPHAPEVFEAVIGDDRIGFAAGFERGEHEGLRVAVVGAGQSAVEAAAAAVRSGAQTTLLARSSVHWFADHEPSHPRGPLQRRLFELAYPAVGYGPPPLNRLVLHPDLFARRPVALRRRLTGRLLRPGASPWLRDAVVGKAAIEEGVQVTAVSCGESAVELTLSNGRKLEVDRVLLGTGYRFRLDRLGFLSPELRDRIRLADGWPVLDGAFRTTEQDVRLVGYPAEGRFGPLARFVLGVPFTAARIATTLGRR
jgi:NADPH-dependent 2,4-dienoyl-CoA reductase/sulfur reductase-like enzyme